jgi:glutathione synthase
MKNILFVADPLEVFKIYKDTTFSMMREAQRRGHTVMAACEPRTSVDARAAW